MSSYYTGRAPPRSRYSVPSGTSSSSTSAYGSDWSTNPGSGLGSGSSSSSRYTPKSYTSGLTPASYSHGHSSYDRSTSSPSPNPYLSSATKGSTASSYLNSYSSLPRSYSSPSRRDGTGVGGSTGIRNYGTSGSPTSSSSASASNKSSSYYPSPSSVTGSYLLGHYSVGPVVQTTSALQAYYNRQAAAAKGATPTSTSTAGSVSAGSGSSAVGNRDRPYSNTGLTGSNSFGAYDSKSRRRAPSPEYIQTKQRQLQNKEGAYVERRGITPGPGTGSGLGSGLGSGTGRQNCDVVSTNKNNVVSTNKNNNNSSNNTKNNLNSSKSGLASHRTSRTDINQVPPPSTVPPPTNNNNNNNVNNNEKKSYKKSLSKRLSASLSSLVFSIGSRSLSNSKLSSPSTENLDHGEFDDDSYSDSVGSGKVSELSYDYNQGAADPNSISDNGVSSRTNYRKLYEGIFKENELLKSCLTRYEKEVDQLKFKLSRLYDQQQQAAQTPPKTITGSEKKAKRTLEVKMEAMELELRQVQKLKLENENIRAENRALTRVVSKLSSKSSKGSS